MAQVNLTDEQVEQEIERLQQSPYVCADLNIPFLDIYHSNVLRPWNVENVEHFYADGDSATKESTGHTGATHPNYLGHLEGIARPVLQWMLKWM